MNWTEFFQESALQALDLRPALLSLVLALGLGQLLAWHYVRYAPVLSNKRKFARVFVFLATTTFLVISVVKTSLALSLGLVGALSIIRFRTPIKEPEDLAYMFLAVAAGIGLGADQRMATCIIFCAILLYMTFFRSGSRAGVPPRMLVHVTAVLDGEQGAVTAEDTLRELLGQIDPAASQVDLRRVDVQGNEFDANLIVDLDGPDQVGSLMSRIQKALPGASVSVIEGSSLD